MKNVKRILSFMLAWSILGTASVRVNVLAETGTDEIYIFSESFDGKTGAVTNIGGVAYSGVDTDITVAEDSLTGSEALKFTITQGGSAGIVISLGRKLDSGKYRVSFEARAENHSKYFERFGQPLNTNSATEVFPGVKANYLYYYSKSDPTPAAYKVNAEKVNKIMKNRYAKFEYIFDADNRTFDMYRDGILIADDQPYYRTGSAVADINSLWFYFSDSTANNGTDNDGTDANNGVYWIDNIYAQSLQIEPENVIPSNDLKSVDVEFLSPLLNADGNIKLYQGNTEVPVSVGVSADALTATLTPESTLNPYTEYKVVAKAGLASSNTGVWALMEDTEYTFTTAHKSDENTIFAECFENYDIGKQYWALGDNNHTAIVENDPVTNSKALKITVDGTAGISQLIKSDKIPTTGVYKVSYALRPEKFQTATKLTRFPNIINSTYGVDATGGALCGANSPENKYFYFIGNTTHSTFAANMENYNNRYIKCSYILDLDNGTYTTQAGGGTVKDYTMWGFSSGRKMDIGGYWFVITPSGTGVENYYLDNLVIEKEPLEVVSSSPENGASVISAHKEYRIGVNMSINNPSGCVNVFKGSEEVSSGYDVSFDSTTNEIIITFEKLQNYSDYKIELNGISAISGYVLPTYTYSFTTTSEAEFTEVKLYDDVAEYVSPGDCAGKTVTASATVNASADTQKSLVVAMYDGTGKMISVKTVPNDSFNDNKAEVNIDIPAEASDEWYVKFMLMSSLDDLRPLTRTESIGGEETLLYVSNVACENGDGSKEEPFSTINNAIAYISTAENIKKK